MTQEPQTIEISEEASKLHNIWRDADVGLFLRKFNAPLGARILVVGAHDEGLASILQDVGFKVTGVDLRPYDKKLPRCNYNFIQGDFCEMDRFSFSEGCDRNEEPVFEPFDFFVSISTIEHFGMKAYGETRFRPYYDIIAMRRAWELLREGGRAYITVPFAGSYNEVWPHWRVYDLASAQLRLVQDFNLLDIEAFISGDVVIDDRLRKAGECLSPKEAMGYHGAPPHVTTILTMEKVSIK